MKLCCVFALSLRLRRRGSHASGERQGWMICPSRAALRLRMGTCAEGLRARHAALFPPSPAGQAGMDRAYREGNASLRESGKPAPESFVTEPEVLDAWVQPRVPR